MRTRVVITGMGAISPYGEGVQAMVQGMEQGRHALRMAPHHIGGSQVSVVGMVPQVAEKRIPRELRRAMSFMSIYSTLAAWEALTHSGLMEQGQEVSVESSRPRMGLALGSTIGSTQALHDFFATFLEENSVESVRTTTFFKVMSHSAASNVALACQIRGRVLAPSAACASGLMALGLGYESIVAGQEQRMLCGGTDEHHALTSATFDRMGAASHAVDVTAASLPFDARRCGVVCGEGAGMLVLESLESALERKAPIFAEVLGFAMGQSANIAQPDVQSIRVCMEEALHNAALTPQDVGYVNAHATATLQGDMAEAQAIAQLLGAHVPVSSFKGHMGHTMAACGALESIACVHMLTQGKMFPTLGLEHIDPLLPALSHAQHGQAEHAKPLLKNCFALGGCVCSLVLDRYYSK